MVSGAAIFSQPEAASLAKKDLPGSISSMDVRKVAKLAHLEITDEEVAIYTPQMANIVSYVEQLNELDIDDVEPMLGGMTAEGEATFTLRNDSRHTSFTQGEALSEAPTGAAGNFRVPK